MDTIRIDGPVAVDIAATVRRINPGHDWREVALADVAGCKLHARRVEGRTQYVIHHRSTYGCVHGDVTQDVMVVPAVPFSTEPRGARLILTVAEKRLKGMVARGVPHTVVAARFATYERMYRAACAADTTPTEWDQIIAAVA